MSQRTTEQISTEMENLRRQKADVLEVVKKLDGFGPQTVPGNKAKEQRTEQLQSIVAGIDQKLNELMIEFEKLYVEENFRIDTFREPAENAA